LPLSIILQTTTLKYHYRLQSLSPQHFLIRPKLRHYTYPRVELPMGYGIRLRTILIAPDFIPALHMMATTTPVQTQQKESLPI
jgi:hypothetical protein